MGEISNASRSALVIWLLKRMADFDTSKNICPSAPVKAIKIAEQAQLYSEPLQQELEGFLSERNWLVHKSIAQSRDDWDLNVSREQLFRRIKAINAQAQKLLHWIEEDLMSFSEANGKDMSRVRAEIQRLFNQQQEAKP